MEFVCLFEYGKFCWLIDVSDDRAFYGNMGTNNFGLYKYVLKCKSTYIDKKTTLRLRKSLFLL